MSINVGAWYGESLGAHGPKNPIPNDVFDSPVVKKARREVVHILYHLEGSSEGCGPLLLPANPHFTQFQPVHACPIQPDTKNMQHVSMITCFQARGERKRRPCAPVTSPRV
jgi:hypothetical protein